MAINARKFKSNKMKNNEDFSKHDLVLNLMDFLQARQELGLPPPP